MLHILCRKHTYVWYAKQDFQFPLELEAQGANTFMELNVNIFPSLVWEFYRNFQYKDGKYVNFVKGKLTTLNEELFQEVGGLASDGSPLGDCNSELWNSYDSTKMYKSCLRRPHYYVEGELAKAGFMIVEKRLPHYLIACVLVQQNTNDTQPTEHLIDDILIHKMNIYEYGGVWMYQEDYHTSVEISDEDDDVIPVEQTQASKPDEAPTMPEEPSFSLAYLDAMEQWLNECVDNGTQAMENRMQSM
ncbi:hypothetical protein Lal_00016957 [Lupinus albus]|nr:hypothetical protein Lal_00016957 [Lupinus albus]